MAAHAERQRHARAASPHSPPARRRTPRPAAAADACAVSTHPTADGTTAAYFVHAADRRRGRVDGHAIDAAAISAGAGRRRISTRDQVPLRVTAMVAQRRVAAVQTPPALGPGDRHHLARVYAHE